MTELAEIFFISVCIASCITISLFLIFILLCCLVGFMREIRRRRKGALNRTVEKEKKDD